MKKFSYFYIILFLFLLIGCANQHNNSQHITIANHELKVEIADTPELRSTGLSNRDHLPTDQGMLFVFENYSHPNFWMKDMRFPIDIIWIKNNQIIGCTENLPIPINNSNLKTYGPPDNINYALEVNAGWCQKNGIKEGDQLSLRGAR